MVFDRLIPYAVELGLAVCKDAAALMNQQSMVLLLLSHYNHLAASCCVPFPWKMHTKELYCQLRGENKGAKLN